jgi:hypothetical protein
MDQKLLNQTVEVNDHIQFIQTALICETLTTGSQQSIDKNKLVSVLAHFSEILPGSTLTELIRLVNTSSVLYDKYRRQYPFACCPIRAFKTSGGDSLY